MQMNLPGSAIGACSRTAPSAWDTGSNRPPFAASMTWASISWLATPPSRKPRVLAGNSAAAIGAARTTPRLVRCAAQLAARSMTRSGLVRAPRRGVWPFWEKRTIFMAWTSFPGWLARQVADRPGGLGIAGAPGPPGGAPADPLERGPDHNTSGRGRPRPAPRPAVVPVSLLLREGACYHRRAPETRRRGRKRDFPGPGGVTM